MSSEWKTVKLGDCIKFSNGKSAPLRDSNAVNPIFGGNGVIDFTKEWNSENETLIVGRVGAYCGSVFKYIGKCWVTDNAIIGNHITSPARKKR